MSYPFEFNYRTPEEMAIIDPKHDREYYRNLLKHKDDLCAACETNTIWVYGETGLCFSCCCGTIDASEDYELRE